jgi:ABC-2 type transport system ATP-binding protein
MLTTLLTPTEGRILINGHDLRRDSNPAKWQIGLVPKESNVYTELTAWDYLMFTASIYRAPRIKQAKRARELLETLDLWEKCDTLQKSNHSILFVLRQTGWDVFEFLAA